MSELGDDFCLVCGSPPPLLAKECANHACEKESN